MRTTLALVVICLGCSSGESALPDADGGPAPPDKVTVTDASAPSPLQGTWVTQIGSSCAKSFTFDTAANTYVEQRLCQSNHTEFLDEMRVGHIDLSGYPGRIVFLPEKTTCPATPEVPYSLVFTVTATTLTLAYSDATVIFVRPAPATTPANGAQILNGCFADDGKTFTSHPLGTITPGGQDAGAGPDASPDGP